MRGIYYGCLYFYQLYMNDTTTTSRKKILLAIDQKVISILDIVIRQKQIPRTRFINQVISDWIQSNKEQIKGKLREYEASLDAK